MTTSNKTDIIIFGGQSNMQGQSEVLTECEVVEGALEYRFLTDTLKPLCNPVGEDIRYDGSAGYRFDDGVMLGEWVADHVLASACYGHTNLVPSFVRAYIKETGKNVIAVPAAKGSTNIESWLPSSPGYRALASKAAAAIKKASETYDIERIYIVWLQGESDAIESVSKACYKERLMTVAESLKADLGIERFGVIRVGRYNFDKRDDEIISAQDEICRESPLFLMLTDIATTLNEDATMMNPYVPGHYSALGLETLGTAAGTALGKHRAE